jgi:hypothetical protein
VCSTGENTVFEANCMDQAADFTLTLVKSLNFICGEGPSVDAGASDAAADAADASDARL